MTAVLAACILLTSFTAPTASRGAPVTDEDPVLPETLLPDTATSVRGVASWYCGGGSACTRGYPPGTLAAAAGPALRVGDWRGRIVKVCAGKRCVRVSLVDWCACGRGRVIDLYRSAFAQLAHPSRGVLHVEVTWGGKAILPVPPTSTTP
jgi:rare lipoprotein A (peptidoglycan hydrolase)